MRLRSDSIRSRLQTKEFGREILVAEECASTNDVTSCLAAEGAPRGFTVLAERQTGGRGRHGRAWISPEGGIWMSIILRPRAQFEHLDGLPLTGALAVALTLSSKFGVKAKVRWPNDVVFQGHKLAGTLVEAKLRGNTPRYALLGLGLNANFPGALLASEVEDATTLFDILGSPVDREELISQIL